MFDFFKKFFAPKKPVIQAPYKIEPQVHGTDTVFVSPPVEQTKKPAKKTAGRSSQIKRKPAAKKS